MNATLCPACGGTGRDDAKTAALAREDAEFRHRVKHHGSYVRCWSCNGNGLDPPYPGVPVPVGAPRP
jgi:hypothetical protein